MRRFKEAETGFGALDLLIVTTVMGILIGMALPKVTHYRDLRLDYEAIRLVNELRDLQATTLTARSLDNSFASVTNTGLNKITTTKNGYYMDVASKLYKTVTLPEGITIEKETTCRFNQYGAGNFTTIKLTDGKNIIKVIIDYAGRVRIER